MDESATRSAAGCGRRAVTVSVHETLTHGSAAQWAALARSAKLYQSNAWLHWAEVHYRQPVRYVLATDADGAPLGAVVACLMRKVPVGLTRWYDPVRMFLMPHCDTVGAPRRWFPVLLVGGYSGYHSEILYAPGLDDAVRAAVTDALLSRCRAIANELGCASLAFMYAPKATCDEVRDALRPSARTIVTSAEAVIPLGADMRDFDDYLAHFPSARRRKLRKEIRDFAAAGGRVAEFPLAAVLDRIAPLMGAHQRRYGDRVTDAEMTHYLEVQNEYLGACSTVFVDERDGDVRGFVLCYTHGGTLYTRAGGFDRARGAPYAYFNVAVYAPIRHAIEHGLTELALGMGSYDGKVLRGAELRALWSVVVPPVHSEPAWSEALDQPSPQAVDAGVT